jgi:prophage regulatory protein
MSATVQPEPMMTHNILRLPAVKASTGLSRSTIYQRISQGLFPKPVSLGARAVGWPASEIAALNAARIAGKSNSEIRDLVGKLEASRNIGR